MQQHPSFVPQPTQPSQPTATDTLAPPTNGDHRYQTRRIGPQETPPSATGAQAVVDATFGTFITPIAASVFYVLLMLVGALVAGWLIFSGEFAEEPLTRAMLVLPAYLVGLLLVRILLEAIVVLFRIEEHLRSLRNGR